MIGAGLNRASRVVLEDALRNWLDEDPAAIAAEWREEAGERAAAALAESLRDDYWAWHGDICNDLVATVLARAGLARVDWPEVARRLLAWAERPQCRRLHRS